MEPAAKRRKWLRGSADDKILAGELVVFDRHSRCQLVESEYELVLNEVSTPTAAAASSASTVATSSISPRKSGSSTWESVNVDKADKVRGEDHATLIMGHHGFLACAWPASPSSIAAPPAAARGVIWEGREENKCVCVRYGHY